MNLEKITIKNFRSIKEQVIKIEHNCIILVGKNEAGKSNILKAIAAVFGEYKISDNDKRKRIKNETIEDYLIDVDIQLSDNDINEIAKRFIEKYPLFMLSGKSTIEDLIRDIFGTIILTISIEKDAKPKLEFYDYSSHSYKSETGEDIEMAILNLWTIVENYYNENSYKCHYWHYKDDYLLPSKVAIPTFTANPNSCKGLKNLFTLCNRGNINKEFKDAISQDGDYINLLEQVSQETTAIFREIWKDFAETSIELKPNGNEILIKVKNEANYSMEDRSEGFKKFVSILLMLSAPSRKNEINDKDIIIIDEPDNSLYPSSARFLRDELLKIAEKSFIIYSTHSQYMIDTNCIDRHYIVEKNFDITSVHQSPDAEYCDDSVLLNAIGVNIFECLKPKNLIFEGWLDKKLFDIYLTSLNPSLQKIFSGIGKVYLHGISGVYTLVQILILADKSFVVISDSDKPSLDKRNDFFEKYPEFQNSWYDYANIISEISTVEDFLKSEYVEKSVKKSHPGFIFDKKKTTIQNIEALVSGNKEMKQQLKKELICNATVKDIKPDYKTFIQVIAKNVK